MKNFYLVLLAIVATAFISCEQKTVTLPVTEPTGGKADFYYLEISPLFVKFYNMSDNGLTPTYWDFGDGHAASGGEDVLNKYANAGTYSVTLTCKDRNGYLYETTKSVTVGGGSGGGGTDATAVYVEGFRIDDIYLTNLMYRFELTGHTIQGFDEQLVHTNYTSDKISRDNLPYIFILGSWVKIGDMPDPFDWYNSIQIDVYAAAKTTLEGANVLTCTIPASVLAGKTEHTAVSTNGTRVTILFRYR